MTEDAGLAAVVVSRGNRAVQEDDVIIAEYVGISGLAGGLEDGR